MIIEIGFSKRFLFLTAKFFPFAVENRNFLLSKKIKFEKNNRNSRYFRTVPNVIFLVTCEFERYEEGADLSSLS